MAALYSDVILDHFRHPRNYGDLSAPDITCEDFNPLCGDRIRIELKLNAKKVADARFKGDGCAISLAAASLLTGLLINRELKELETISDDQLLAALESDIKPVRMQCALLALRALQKGFEEYNHRKLG
jgi:nitrogen fixation protein NifU and related proteins